MRTTLLLILLVIWTANLQAQIPIGGTPPSLKKSNADFFSVASFPRESLPDLDMVKILAEDQQGPDIRFAAPISVSFSLAESGLWTDLPNGDRVWRLYFHSRGAKALIAYYQDFYLPPGAELFMYTPDGQQVLGAYTSLDNPKGGQFMTGLLYGDEAIIEYLEPASVRNQGKFSINRIDHAYKAVAQSEKQGGRSPALGFGASLPCQIGADCPEASPVAELRQGVCRVVIALEEGTAYCTGNLLNNTAEDGKPYILTGFHCIDGYSPIFNLWRFDFNYRSVGCSQPVVEPQFNSMMGGTYRAGRRENDFLLVELNNPVPVNFGPYFLGWNRQADPPDTSYMFHHPRADVQKFSRSTQKGTIFNGSIMWSNDVTTPRSHHFDVDFTEGNFEVGSSGAAQLNTKGQVVGQLNGGNPDTLACDFSQAWFGRLSLAWEGGGTPETRLSDWLDPLGTDVMEMGGLVEAQLETVNGTILSYSEEEPIGGVQVTLSLDGNEISVMSAADGSFSFPNVGAAVNYTLGFSKNTKANNGVSGLDILDIQRHILNLQELLDPYRQLAADVNDSGSISALDVISMRRVILALETAFGSGIESWKFLPKSYEFPDPQKPWTPTPPTTISSATVADLQNLVILGIKRGDVNGSANGQE